MKKTANIDWIGNTLMSNDFDDVYFNTDDAIKERNYTFLQGNELIERFKTHITETFIIAETGFGTGLNFIATWDLFEQFKTNHPNSHLQTLHFISVEKYPLSKIDIEMIYQKTGIQTAYPNQTQTLCSHWFPAELNVDTHVFLSVINGDAMTLAPYLKAHHLLVDAWYFDGFNPSKNPDMWSESLFSSLYACSQNKASFATFTASSQVKRAIE